MTLVDLSLLKKHVRADDFEDDDEYLASILEAAGAWVVESTARTEDELLELGGGSLPPQLRQAVLLVAGHWYNQREAVSSVSMSEVPYTVQALVRPFRRLVPDTEDSSGSSAGTSNSEILAAVERVQAAVEENSGTLAEVRTAVEGVATDVAAVKSDAASLKEDVAGVKTDVAEVKSDVAAVKESTDGLGDKIDTAEKAVNENVDGLYNLVSDNTKAVENDISDVRTDISALSEDVGNISAALETDTKTITDAVSAAEKAVTDSVSASETSVRESVTSGVNEVKSAVSDTGKEIIDAMDTLQTAAVAFDIECDFPEALVSINGMSLSAVFVPSGSTVTWDVSVLGYKTRSGSQVVTEDTVLRLGQEDFEKLADGVYVAYFDLSGQKRIVTPSYWEDSLGSAAGALIIDGEHKVLVAPTESDETMYWSSGASSVAGVTSTKSSDTAQEDFNGKANTLWLFYNCGFNYGGGWCSGYAYGRLGVGEWWEPACGELWLIYEHLAELDAALTAIGGTEVQSDIYWSSTEYDSSRAWTVNMSNGKVAYTTKNSVKCRVRAVAAF